MAIGTGAAIAIGAGALLGGIAGGQKNQSSQTQTSNVNAGIATKEENLATQAISDQFRQLQDYVNLGPGEKDITAGVDSQRSLAAMLESYSKGGYAPTAQDQELAKAQLAPQQVALDQNLRDIREQAARQQALAGRGPTDFVFNNRLNRNQLDLTQQLSAQQSALAAQQPFQRLNFASDLANIRSGLASQAMQNRQAILSIGSQIQNAERNFRLGTASRSGNQTTESGGGLQGAIGGALGGAGAMFGIANAFGGGAKPGAAAAPAMAMGSSMFGGSSPYSSGSYLGGGASAPMASSGYLGAFSAPSFTPSARMPASMSPLTAPAPVNYGAPMGPMTSTQPYYSTNPFSLTGR